MSVNMTEEVQSDEVFKKLDALKDIRDKTEKLETLKMNILKEIEASDQEDKCLIEYRKELELLLQEKMAHVEELRQIHADINAMESVIKKAEESRNRSMERAKQVHDEYKPLKTDIDLMRRDLLGLERLPELHEEESDLLRPDLFVQTYFEKQIKPAVSTPPNSDWHNGDSVQNLTQAHQHAQAAVAAFLGSQAAPLQQLATSSKMVNGGPVDTRPIPPIPGPPAFSFENDHSAAATVMGNVKFKLKAVLTSGQQPPPMKSCLSCHQQIHRNAPICPLCKAKSRSRNPKKPKKKD
ncbi:zinc finger C4H2 domain-containing protein isoform X1 [Metopolophium dirhodum]|uniref:zinc finger C4H2 domain-containing protein isoform X1 n=1 Tax=Metopolophium dirhodum TaxID=44670 RepID=UPI00298F82C9|nr:zinc finger C4H2 domain-containing protein isoform X1 [Metopolophium dirhodum]